MAKSLENIAKVKVKSRSDLRSWLRANHRQTTGVWLVSYKKNSQYYLPYRDIVRECLCFGWIDSLPRKLDEEKTMHYISPRKQGSNWSRVNKEHIAKLEQAGLLHKAGLQKIERAKKDGSWYFLDDVAALILPDDLKLAFSGNKIALENWTAFAPSSKRGILEWIKNAKKTETRAKRIQETVTKAGNNIKVR